MADAFGVSAEVVGRLVRKARTDPQHLRKQSQKQHQREVVRGEIGEAVLGQMALQKTIRSASQVKDLVQQKRLDEQAASSQEKEKSPTLSVSLAKVRAVLKGDCQLRYGKSKKCPNQANSLRNLYLRQQFGRKMLDLLSEGKRILNIDETWIGQINFERGEWKDWRQPSQPLRPVIPRVTMIVALDNLGDLCLMGHNTNQFTFREYMLHLINHLDRPGWRKDTVLQLDGAKWHKTENIKELFEELRVPVMISAPYSYHVAVCELFFAMFKRGELNPQQFATSKSKCSTCSSFSSSLVLLQSTSPM